MSEQDVLAKRKVRHKGVFDFAETYRFCYDWFMDNGYFLTEKNYTEKVAQRGKEVEIQWEAFRKISDYFKFVIKASWRILGLTDVEVEEDGKKVKMNQGDLTINFTAVIEKDYENRWESNSFTKFMRGVYDKYIIKGRIDQYEEKLFLELDELIAQMRSYLALTIK
jgi:hypothetical protein